MYQFSIARKRNRVGSLCGPFSRRPELVLGAHSISLRHSSKCGVVDAEQSVVLVSPSALGKIMPFFFRLACKLQTPNAVASFRREVSC